MPLTIFSSSSHACGYDYVIGGVPYHCTFSRHIIWWLCVLNVTWTTLHIELCSFLTSLWGNSLGDCGIEVMVDVEDSRLETLKYVS